MIELKKDLNERKTEDMKTKKILFNRCYYDDESAARWAIFFHTLGIKFEYKPEKIRLKNGKYFEPDFILHHFVGRFQGAIYASLCGYDDDYYDTVYEFINEKNGLIDRPLLILNRRIPSGSCMGAIDSITADIAYTGYRTETNRDLYPFNFETIDGDHFCAHIGVNKEGKPELFGDDSTYLEERDDRVTFSGYEMAKILPLKEIETPEGRY